MVKQHHQLNMHEFEQTPGNSEGQGSLVCCSSWGGRELDIEQQQQRVQTYQITEVHGFIEEKWGQ